MTNPHNSNPLLRSLKRKCKTTLSKLVNPSKTNTLQPPPTPPQPLIESPQQQPAFHIPTFPRTRWPSVYNKRKAPPPVLILLPDHTITDLDIGPPLFPVRKCCRYRVQRDRRDGMELCREAVWHALERDEHFRRLRSGRGNAQVLHPEPSQQVPEAWRTPLEHHRTNVIDFGALSCNSLAAQRGDIDSDEHSSAEDSDTDTDTDLDDVKASPSPSPDDEEEEEEEGRIYVLSYDTMQWTPMTRSSVRFELD